MHDCNLHRIVPHRFSVLLTVYCFWKLPMDDKKRFAVQAIAGAVITIIVAKIASKLFYDPRPFVVGHFTPYFGHSTDNGFHPTILYCHRSWAF